MVTAKGPRVLGHGSDWGGQFASQPVPVERSTDYVLLLDLAGASDDIAVRVTDRSGKSPLAIANISEVVKSTLAANGAPQNVTVPLPEEALPALGARVPAPFGRIPLGGAW